MNDVLTAAGNLSAQQEAIRARCFHPSGSFAEFSEETLEQPIPARFEEIVRKYPDMVAIKSRKRSLSYLALNEEANRIAWTILAHCGETPEPVGVYLDHDWAIVAAILGVLKANKFYVPLDPNDPPARNQSMLQDSGARTILASGSTLPSFKGLAISEHKIILIEEMGASLPIHNPALSGSSDALAYIMYTSGSTGKPKAVMQTHRNLLQQTLLYTNTLHISPHDRLSLLHSCSNGACTPNLFGSLLNGAALYLFDVKVNGVAQLNDFLSSENVTIYHSIPALFRSLAHSLRGVCAFSTCPETWLPTATWNFTRNISRPTAFLSTA
jgi:non-ribosomal peptide synthetase component F